MSHSQFHCTGRVYLDLHGLIFETSICYWQDQPGSPEERRGTRARARSSPSRVCVCWARLRGGGDQAKLLHLPWGSDAQGVREIAFSGDPPPAGGFARGTGSRAAGPVVGLLGRTGRLGLATDSAAREESCWVGRGPSSGRRAPHANASGPPGP